LGGIFSAAVVKRWYTRNHKNDSTIYIKDLDSNPELNDPRYCLYFKKYELRDKLILKNYDMILLIGVTPDKEYIYKVLESRAAIVWITNKISKEDGTDEWLINGLREKGRSNFELAWNYFLPDLPYPGFSHIGSILELADRYLVDKIEETENEPARPA
jgi:hypothetical protein